jgi:hypothetical protein
LEDHITVIAPKPFEYQRRTVHLFGPCVGASALLAGVSPAALAAIDGAHVLTQHEMTFVSLDMGDFKLADGVDAYIFDDSRVCIDLDQFSRALEFQIKYSPDDHVAKGWFLDETRLFHLDMNSKRITVGGTSRSFPEGGIFKSELGLCVTTEVLQDWFPVNLKHEPQGALISLASREPLPIELRLEREARKRSLEDQLVPEPDVASLDLQKVDYSWYHIPSIDIFGRADFVANEFGNNRRSVSYNAIAVGEIAKMTAEALLQSDSGAIPDSLRLRLYRRDESGGVFGVPALTEVSVGDVSSISNSLLNISAPGRGISLSSFPLNTADEFDRTTLRGDMPIGWEAELYRNDALVAFQDSNDNGRYEFKDVPVFFGVNDFKIVLHGPQGQRREIGRLLNTGAVTVPPGKFYGRAVAQQDFRELIRIRSRPGTTNIAAPFRLQAEGRYGLLNNLSVGGSISSFEQQGERQTYGALNMQTSFGRAYVNLEGITSTNGQWAAEASLHRSFSNLSLQLRHAQFSQGFGSQKVVAGIESRTDASVTSSMPFIANSRLPLSMRAVLNRQYDGSAQLSADGQASVAFGGNNIAQSFNVNSDLTGSQPTLVSGSTIYSRRLSKSGIRGFATYDIAPKLDLRALGIGYDQYTGTSAKKWYWSANADWQFKEKVGNFSVGASREFGRFSMNLEAATSTRGAWSVGASIAFSLSRDPIRQGWSMSPESSAQSGNVIARIFEDIDNDGRFSTDDIPLKNAEIVSDSFGNSRTDATGRVFLIGLPSNTPTVLRAMPPVDYPVDLIEAKLNNAVVARAGTVNSVDIPMMVSGSIEGQIDFVRGNASRPLRGIMVKLVGERRTIIQHSEFDGFYLFQDIPTGQYQVELDESQLESMGLTGSSMRGIEVSRKRPYPAGVNFKLEAREQNPNLLMAKSASMRSSSKIAVNGMFSDAIAGQMSEPHIFMTASYTDIAGDIIAQKPLELTENVSHRATLQALYGDEIMSLPLLEKHATEIKLLQLFGDEVMSLPLRAPSPTQQPLPPSNTQLPPSIVVIGPKFEDALATERRHLLPKKSNSEIDAITPLT